MHMPKDILALLGLPPVLKTENLKLYWQLFDKLVALTKPADILEWLWVKEATDYAWEALRLQRFKSVTIELARKHAIEKALRKLLPGLKKSYGPDVVEEINRLTQGWFNDPTAKRQIVEVLNAYGLPLDAIDAEAYACCIDTVEKLNDQLGVAAARRDAALREIERRREPVVFVHPRSRVADADVANPKAVDAKVLDAEVVEKVPAPNAPSQKIKS
jgi:hypothetical protein